MMGLMDKDSIFCGIESDDPDRFLFIEDEKELLQVLHHAVAYEKDNCLHAVGNTKMLLSCTHMTFTP